MSGIASKWKRDAEVDAAPCAIPKGIQGTQLKNEELRMIYYILLISYGCGVALLLLEVGWGRLLDQCGVGAGHRRPGQSLSVLQRVLGQETGAAGKTAWPAGGGGGDQDKPGSTFTYGMSVNPASVSTWVSTARSPPPPAGLGSGAPAAGSAASRSDREVLQEMRDNIKYINNRPYMFVTGGDGSVRPVPVTEERSEVFERVFKELKERPGSSRIDDQFGDLYSPEHLMRQ